MTLFSTAQMRRAERHFAFIVAAAFMIGGFAWVLLTDLLLYGTVRDPSLLARFTTLKGWIFVMFGGFVLYPILRMSASRLTRTQATLSAVVESIVDGVLLLGADRTIVHANPAAVRMLRCENASELIGVGGPEFVRRYRVSSLDGALVSPGQLISQRVFDESGPLEHKVVLHPPGGPDVIISSTAAAVRMKVDAPAEIVVSVMHDISDTEHLEDLRNQFFAAAAHSLKTPVAIIQANIQMLSRDLAAEVSPSVAAIQRQCGRIDRLVDNLLALARARTGTLQLYPTQVELRPLVEDVVREMTRASLKHEVRVEALASPRIYADQERLGMSLRNIIDGALRLAEANTPITVRLARRGEDAEIGVHYRHRPAEETSSAYREYDDMGVSHYVTTTVVKAHGGALRKETVGSQTTHLIHLPTIEEQHEFA